MSHRTNTSKKSSASNSPPYVVVAFYHRRRLSLEEDTSISTSSLYPTCNPRHGSTVFAAHAQAVLQSNHKQASLSFLCINILSRYHNDDNARCLFCFLLAWSSGRCCIILLGHCVTRSHIIHYWLLRSRFALHLSDVLQQMCFYHSHGPSCRYGDGNAHAPRLGGR